MSPASPLCLLLLQLILINSTFSHLLVSRASHPTIPIPQHILSSSLISLSVWFFFPLSHATPNNLTHSSSLSSSLHLSSSLLLSTDMMVMVRTLPWSLLCDVCWTWLGVESDRNGSVLGGGGDLILEESGKKVEMGLKERFLLSLWTEAMSGRAENKIFLDWHK